MKISLLSGCLWVVLLSGTIARADEIPNITINASGPDQELPTNRSFYVSGDAGKHTRTVQIAIVRKGSAWLWGGDGPSCTELATDLVIDRPRAPALDPGVHDVRAQFPAAKKPYRDGKVLLSASWVRPEPGGDTYKALVAASPAFFAPGYAYCLFIFKQTQKVDDDTIARLIDGVTAALDQCGRAIASGGSLTTAEADCKRATQQQFEADIARLLDEALIVSGGKPGAAPADCAAPSQPFGDREKASCALHDKITEALGHAVTVFLDRKALDAELTFTGPAADLPRGWIPTSSDLGAAIVTMLTSQGSLFPSVKDTPPTRTVQHLTRDAKIDASYVSILDDDLRLRVSSSPSPAGDQARILDGVTTKDLMVVDGVSLHDLLQLRKGIVRSDKDVSFAALREAVRGTTARAPWSAVETTMFQAAARRLGLVSDMLAKPRPAAFEEETPTAVRVHLNAWLTTNHVLPAMLDDLAGKLAQLVVQKPAYDRAAANLTFVAAEQVQLGGPKSVGFQIGFDQETWVFSYLTPTIGYAQIDTQDGWLSKQYLGVQLHFAPNPVNRPLWQHGFCEDLPRAFALEVGLATSMSAFGPDDRYRGIFGLPTVFVGGVVHVIPYTSITFGRAFVERRSTVLPVETPEATNRWFIGLNVQVNLPDLLHKEHTTAASSATPPSGAH
jgi:hypothetical protein